MEAVRLSDCNFKDNIGERLDVIFLVKSVTIREYSNKSGEFMIVTMKDKDKEVEAKIWVVSEQIKNTVVAGKVCEAFIDVKPYDKSKDGFSCIIASIGVTEYNPELFIEWDETLEICNKKLQNLLVILQGSVYDDICRKIILENWQKYASWAAGKGKHHTQLGALLCHCVSVAAEALKAAEHYNEIYNDKFINKQLLVAAGLLHDIGKLKELHVDISSGAVEYTKTAVLKTHIMEGLLIIDREAVKLGIDPDSEEIMLLEHLIASHHGRLEWGSPVEPTIPEAVLLHYADVIDSEMWRYHKEFKQLEGGNFSTIWVGGKASNIYKEIWKSN